MDKEDVVYIYNEKEGNPAICDSKDGTESIRINEISRRKTNTI